MYILHHVAWRAVHSRLFIECVGGVVTVMYFTRRVRTGDGNPRMFGGKKPR